MEFYTKHNILMFFATLLTTIALLIYLYVATKSEDKSKYSFPVTIMAFAAFTAMIGLTLAPIFLIYTKSSIFSTFFVTALIFGLAALNGVTTKCDMSKWLPHICLAMIGIMAISFINYFIDSKPIDYLISIVGVLVFTILTAIDFQKIKKRHDNDYDKNTNQDELTQNKNALFDSIGLFLDFVQIFIHLLELMGEKKKSAVENDQNPRINIDGMNMNMNKICVAK